MRTFSSERCLLRPSPSTLPFIIVVFFLTTTTQALTLQAGERIRSQTTVPQIASSSQNSLWDVLAVEQWATQRGLTEHHLKALYPTLLQLPLVNDDDDDPTGTIAFTKLLRDNNSFPRAHVDELLATFPPRTCSILQQSTSFSTTSTTTRTTKLLIGLPSSGAVETVVLEHKGRVTVCVSSQVGCARACSFCATGTMGMIAQVTAGEILQQVHLAQSVLVGQKKIRNVVFMGMGEPLDNYAHVHEACRGFTHQRLFGLPAPKITISTVGASPRHIRLLADQAPTISVAVSLHGATQDLRQELLPSAAAAADIDQLQVALQYHGERTGRTVMIEYLLIAHVNDTPEALEALISFCQRGADEQSRYYYINLIPYNPTAVGDARQYQAPSRERVQAWADTLREKCSAKVHVRWSTMAGRETEAACGQLVVEQSK